MQKCRKPLYINTFHDFSLLLYSILGVLVLDFRSVWRSVKGTLLNAPSLRSVRLPLYPLDSPPFCSPTATPKKGTVEAKASTALFRLPIVPQKPTSLVRDNRKSLQGALPPAPPVGGPGPSQTPKFPAPRHPLAPLATPKSARGYRS